MVSARRFRFQQKWDGTECGGEETMLSVSSPHSSSRRRGWQVPLHDPVQLVCHSVGVFIVAVRADGDSHVIGWGVAHSLKPAALLDQGELAAGDITHSV